MKKIYTIIFACLLTSAVFAQTTESKGGIKFGIKAGVNLAKMSLSGFDGADEFNDEIKSQTSFQIGGYADIPVASSFSVQPGLTLSGKGFKSEEKYDGGSETVSANIMYLEIPVNAVYKIGGIYLGAGPYAAFALSGKIKSEDKEDGEPVDKDEYDLKFGTSDEDDFKGVDFGVNFLAGYQLTNGLNFGLNYGLGLSDISNSEVSKTKNKVFSVTVGFSF